MCLSKLKELSISYGGNQLSDIETIEQMIKETYIKLLEDIKNQTKISVDKGTFSLEGETGFDITRAAEDMRSIESVIRDKFNEVSMSDKEIVVYTTRRGSEGKAIFDTETETIKLLKGSKCNKDTVKTFAKHLTKLRKSLIKEGTLVDYNKDYYELTKDRDFDNANTAASFLSGGSTCTYELWATEEGVSLKDIMGRPSKLSEKKPVEIPAEEPIEIVKDNVIEVFTDINGAEAKGVYHKDTDKLVLKSGSKLVKESTENIPKKTQEIRLDLLRKGIIKSDGDKYVALEDIVLEKPANITNMVVHNSKYWKDMWRTLDGNRIER